MKFKEIDEKMRVYETYADTCVLPQMYIVARLDGRSFTRLTKEVCQYEAPFDDRFRDLMVSTTRSLMQCGFDVVFGYTQSDEISLLLGRDERAFGRKLRKLNSVLAGEASSHFSIALGKPATFDCRVSQLPNKELVCDYFRWRNQDSVRNALNAHCYWALRKSGIDARLATRRLAGMNVAKKNELLFSDFGINFNDLPAWQKRGTGLYWQSYLKDAVNPKTGKNVKAKRRKICVDLNLPTKDAYLKFIASLCCNSDD